MYLRTLYLFVVLFLALIPASCSPDEDIPSDSRSYLTIAGNVPTLWSAPGNITLHFSTNEKWHIETTSEDSAAEWFEVDPVQGRAGEAIAVTIRVDANPAYLDRSFTLTIRTASLEKSIEITQLKRNAIIAGENRYEISGDPQTFSIGIQANVDYDVEIAEGADWLAVADDTRTEPGLTATEHCFSAAINPESRKRTARILFTDLASDLQDEVTVVQGPWPDPDPERTALRAIYEEAGGDGWTHSDNWCSDRPLGEWYGVTTDDEGHVVELRLSRNNLRGGIAHEIANLKHLRILDLSRNELEYNFVYRVPEDEIIDFMDWYRSDLDDLKLLEEIDLSHNKIYSSLKVMPSFTGFDALRKIDLSYNQFRSWICGAWSHLFENGRTVDLIFNGNIMFGKIDNSLQNHSEWDRLALQLVRQYHPGSPDYDREIHVPEFTFTDMRTGNQQSIRTLCSQNERTMILAWDPTDEKSIRFAERSVRRYHTLYEKQGFAVVAIVPEGEEYRRAAERYLATHEVAWPVVADYADAAGRRIILSMEPYPSYLLFDRKGTLVDDIFTGISYSRVRDMEAGPLTFDITEHEFQYANYMHKLCYRVFGDCTYESTDYSMDKKTELLQQATKGKGIDILLIGDAFTDVDIETGFYRGVMEYAMEAFFSVEPMKSYREYFNVYMIYAVSKCRQLSQDSRSNSAMKTSLNTKGQISPWTIYIDEYLKVVNPNKPEKFPSIIVNASGAGITFMDTRYNYAFSGLHDSRGYFRNTFIHESVGHGFGLLGDEYVILKDEYREIPESKKDWLQLYQSRGEFLNVSVTNDPSAVPWAHLIGHPLYPEVGIYEGAYLYSRGVWRSGDGIMHSSFYEDFNPVCRELLVRRILTLAGEEYTFEKFLEKDIPSTRSSVPVSSNSFDAEIYRHNPPVVIGRP